MSGTNGDAKDLLVELAALETLEGDARPLTEKERASLDPAYVAARDDFARVAASLGLAAAAAAPPPSVKERLLARVAEAEAVVRSLPAGGFFVKPGVTGVRTSDAAWQATFVKGLSAKVIHRDETRGTTMRLLRIEPGARYPWHRHGGPEEIFMISGTLWVNGVLLKAGDYCRSEAGTDESGTYSDDGATAVIVSSDNDEVDFTSATPPAPR